MLKIEIPANLTITDKGLSLVYNVIVVLAGVIDKVTGSSSTYLYEFNYHWYVAKDSH